MYCSVAEFIAFDPSDWLWEYRKYRLQWQESDDTIFCFTSNGLSLLSHHSVHILSGVGTAEWNVCTELGACSYEFRYVIYLTLSLTCYIILGKSHYIFELQFPDLKNERLVQDQKSRTQMPVVRATGWAQFQGMIIPLLSIFMENLDEQCLLEVCSLGVLPTGEPDSNTIVLIGPGYNKIVSQPVAKPERSCSF